MSLESELTRACDKAIRVMTFRWIGPDVYACEEAGEVSLVNRETLVKWISNQLEGGTNEVGGGDVGRA